MQKHAFLCVCIIALVASASPKLRKYALKIINTKSKWALAFAVYKKRNYIIAHRFLSVNQPRYSTCVHGVSSGFCALCFCAPYFRLDAIGNCIHNFVALQYRNQNLGILCDFDGACHIAVTSAQSVAYICPMCNAVSCSNCFVG